MDVGHLLAGLLAPSAPVFVLGALVVLLVPLLLHWLLTRAAALVARPAVLLVGPAGAGKTALLTRLERRASEPARTATSQVAHAVELAVADATGAGPGGAAPRSYRDDLDAAGAVARSFLLVDTPGHGKLRGGALGMLGRGQVAVGSSGGDHHPLRAVVFVVDGAALADDDDVAAAAAYLHDVLLALQVRQARATKQPPPPVPVLVAANKADLFTALPAARVQARLEAELGRLRAARSKGLLDSGSAAGGTGGAAGPGDDDDDDPARTWLGAYGTAAFALAQLRDEYGIAVDVVAGNVVGDGPGIDAWWAWIAARV